MVSLQLKLSVFGNINVINLHASTVSVDEPMMQSFGRHGAKQYILKKHVNYGNKFRVTAKLFGNGIWFILCAGKISQLNEM